MKKLVFPFLLIICFALNISGQEKKTSESESIPTVDYCELKKNPGIYNGKTIRIQGIYERTFEVSRFYDKACEEKSRHSDYKMWVHYYKTNAFCADQKTADAIQTFIYGNSESEAEVTLLGKFFGTEKGGGFGHLNGYEFLIDVSCIEQVKLLPTERYGCRRVDETKSFHSLSYEKIETTEAPNYDKNSKKSKKEKLVLIRLNNNSSCPITIPTALDESENPQLKNQSKIPVIYELSSQQTNKKSRLISDRKQTLSILSAGESIIFAVPLRYLTEKPFVVRVAFNLLTQKADFYYQPFYFSQYNLPENLRKD